MKILAKQNRELIMINARNTQNENDAEKIILQVPEQYEDFNKKIVFITPDGNVWDIITNNEYLIKRAITKYKQVDFYIWLTKGDVDFRSQTKTLKFYHNVDASDEITDEEIGRVNTVVNLLEEEITKVENLESQIDGKLEEVDTAIDNIHTAIQETENLDLDAEKEGQTTTVTLTKKDGTTKTVHIDDGVDLQYIWRGTSLGIKTAEQAEYTFVDLQGATGIAGPVGPTGNGIASIRKTGTSGLVDTYTITYTNGNTTTFTVTNGEDANIKARLEQIETDLNNCESVNKSQSDTIAEHTTSIIANTTEITNARSSAIKNKTFASVDARLEDIELDTKANTTDISQIKEEQTTQNENISTNADEITNLKNENSYLQNVVKQAFTEATASGTELTIDNTIEARMDLKLKGNTSQQQYSGKNLVPITAQSVEQNGVTFTINNNQLTINGTATDYILFFLNDSKWSYSANNLILEAGTYNLSFNNEVKFSDDGISITIYNENSKIIYTKSRIKNNLSFSISEKGSCTIRVEIMKGQVFDNNDLQLQIEQGSTATDYEPYVGGTASPNPDYPQDIKVVSGDNTIKISNSNNTLSQSFPISLGSLELCKIGDYQDYIYKKDNKWYKHKAINKNTLNGNERWHFGRTKTNYTNLFTSSFQNDIKIPANNNINSNTLIYCDKFSNNTSASQQWENDTMSSVTINDGKNITFNIPNSIATTEDEFKTYLISNNITLYYVLATPTEEEITDTTLITQLDEISQALSKKGTTIISQNNDDLPFNLDVIALTK